MEKLPGDNPWRDQELNLPTQARGVNPTNRESTKKCFFLGLDPKSCGLGWEAMETGEHWRRISPVVSLHSSSLCCSKECGEDGRFHIEDKASPLPTLEFWGYLLLNYAGHCCPDGPSHSSTDISDCDSFLQTEMPRNAPHLNRKAFLNAFSFPQYLETSSLGQFT